MNMEMPSVVHPTRFTIKGMVFEVVSYEPLSDSKAATVAMQFFRSHKFKKKDQGKLFRVLWTHTD